MVAPLVLPIRLNPSSVTLPARSRALTDAGGLGVGLAVGVGVALTASAKLLAIKVLFQAAEWPASEKLPPPLAVPFVVRPMPATLVLNATVEATMLALPSISRPAPRPDPPVSPPVIWSSGTGFHGWLFEAVDGP